MTYSIQYPSEIPDPDFPQLMIQLRARLHRYCSRMTGSVLDGEDIVQETLLKANERYDARQVQNVEGWLFRIAHNTAMDFLRGRTREYALFTDDVDAVEAAAAGAQSDAERRVVATAALRTFMRLPPAQRSAVILADVLGYDMEEAAAVVASTVPALKAALHRGRKRLQEIASRPEDAAPPPALSAADQALLHSYADRFNARDWDGLRDMLAHDVQLDLVARRKPMPARGGEYFTNYAKLQGLRVAPANIEGMPALWVDVTGQEGPGHPGYFIVLQAQAGKVTRIRDFRYARYAGEAGPVEWALTRSNG
jgi:RNA polymerase sigma-70 factor (ECF subfamily)